MSDKNPNPDFLVVTTSRIGQSRRAHERVCEYMRHHFDASTLLSITCWCRSLQSPEALNRIDIEGRIDAENGDTLDHRLRDQESIEGISVVER